MIGGEFLFPMLRKKLATARGLWREGGARRIYDYSRVRLHVLAKGNKPTVKIDGCTFRLEGITDDSTIIELVTNQYEAPERSAIARYLKRDLPVIELGGSMGVVSCVTNKLLQDRTRHVVVEANPLAIPHLKHNRRLNGSQFEIVNRAIAYGVESVTFRPSTSMLGNSITVDGDLSPVTVQTVRLGDLVREHGFDRFNLICDIEGVEFELVCHESEALKKVDTLIMETHARFIGEDKSRLMIESLQALGLRMMEESEFVVVLQVPDVA